MMRQIKFWMLSAALFCSCVGFAQSTGGTAAGKKFNLGLTQQQKTQLHNLRTTMQDQVAVIRHDTTLTEQQKQQQIQQLRQSIRAQINAVFTPEQQQKLAQMKAARQAKLGLTAEQQSQLKSLFAGARQQRASVLNTASLSSQDKQTQLQQIRQNVQTQLSTILTPDQLQKMQHMRRGRRGWGAQG